MSHLPEQLQYPDKHVKTPNKVYHQLKPITNFKTPPMNFDEFDQDDSWMEIEDSEEVEEVIPTPNHLENTDNQYQESRPSTLEAPPTQQAPPLEQAPSSSQSPPTQNAPDDLQAPPSQQGPSSSQAPPLRQAPPPEMHHPLLYPPDYRITTPSEALQILDRLGGPIETEDLRERFSIWIKEYNIKHNGHNGSVLSYSTFARKIVNRSAKIFKKRPREFWIMKEKTQKVYTRLHNWIWSISEEQREQILQMDLTTMREFWI